MGTVQEDGIYGPPDLMVEVTSLKPNLDRVCEVPQVRVLRRAELLDHPPGPADARRVRAPGQAKVAALKDKETFAPALFPGLVIPLAKLWG